MPEEMGSLVLTRKEAEVIEIAGGQIIVTVLEIRGDKVRIRVTAPKDITVHRAEVAEAIRRENRGGIH